MAKEIKTEDVEKFDEQHELFTQEEQLEEAREKINRLYPVREVVDTAPTYTPYNEHEQIVLHSSGGVYSLYVWFGESIGWVSTTLT